jgi:tripartite ATP-independent transporter DctM subunit
MAVSNEVLGLVSLAVLFISIFIGFPIAFTLIAVALVFGYVALENVVFHLMVLQVFGIMKDPTLAAVPLFTFMGYILEQAGLMERIFKGFQLALASVNGSLYLAVLVTATIFGIGAGIVGSTITMLGVMAGPMMIKSGYDVQLSAGAITAGGTLGILIPPSVMLVVMAPVVGVPATHLFAACTIPGLLLAAMYCGYTTIRSYLDPKLGPPLPPEQHASSYMEVVRELAIGVVPVVVVIFATLVTILMGIATPTDAAAVGCFVSVIMAAAYRRLTWNGFKASVFATLEISSMVLILVAASNFYGAVFSRLGSAAMITESLLDLPLPPTAMLLVILLLIFLLGWPLEWVPIVLVVVPIVLPMISNLASTCYGSRPSSRYVCKPRGSLHRLHCRPIF